MGNDFFREYVLLQLLPLVVATVVVSVAVVGILVRDRSQLRRLLPLVLIKAFIVLGSLGYISTSFNALQLFDCTRLPDDRYYLDANLGVRCFTARWWAHVPLGMLAVVAYVIAVPAVFLLVLVRNRARLDDSEVRLRYGSLYAHHHEPRFFYEVGLAGGARVV